MSVGADLLVAGLVDKECGPQWTHAGARMRGLSLGKEMPGPLQVAGPDVLCQCSLQVVGQNLVGLAGVVQPPTAGFVGVCVQPPAEGFAGVCKQPPMAGLAGVCGQPPAASL